MARALRNAGEKRGRVPPQNLEAEQSLLAGVLVDPESMNKVVDILLPEDFYRDDHARVFELMLDLYEKNEPIDIVTSTTSWT
jgi:replicative DNA helicase